MIFALAIATLGDHAKTGNGSTTLGRCYRWASGVPDFDTDGLYRSVALVRPQEAYASVNWQQGTAQTSEMTFTLRHTAELGAALGTYRHRRLGRALATLTSIGTSLSADFNPGVGAHLIWERECMRVSAVSGSGPYTLTLQRGVLGTQAIGHNVSIPGADVELFDAGAGPNLLGQLVELYAAHPHGTSYGTGETILWRGVLRDIQSPEPGVYTLTADSLLGLVRDGVLFKGAYTARLEAANPDGWTYVSDDVPVGLQDGYALFDVGGACAVCQVYTYSSAPAPRTAVLVWPPGSNAGFTHTLLSPTGPLPDRPPDTIRELYSTRPDAPGLTPYSSNALDLVLQLLTTTANGLNGAWDLGTAHRGLGVPVGLIDTDTFERLKNQLGPAASIPAWTLNAAPGTVKAHDLIAQILRPLHCVLRPTRAGLLGISRLSDAGLLGTGETFDLGDALTSQRPRWHRYGVRPFDVVEATYNARPGGSSDRVEVRDALNLRRLPSAYTLSAALNLGHLDDLGAAQAVVLGYAARYHWPIPVVSWTVGRGALNADVGDLVYLSGSTAPSPDGTWGLDSVAVQISSRRDDLRAWTTSYQAWAVGALSGAVSRWSLSATITAWSDPTATIEANDYSHTDGPFDSDAEAWAYALANNDGDPIGVLVLDANLALRGTGKVEARSGNDLTLSNLTVTPAAGDVLVLVDAGSTSGGMLALWAWLDNAQEWGV